MVVRVPVSYYIQPEFRWSGIIFFSLRGSRWSLIVQVSGYLKFSNAIPEMNPNKNDKLEL
jgi:hypothetical protein